MAGSKSNTALKALQWFIRSIQLICAALILAIYSYFLATLGNHGLSVNQSTKSVEGIAGVSILYIFISLLLLCCFAGRTFSSFIVMLLDVAFACAYIYVAVANKTGASSCSGDNLSTPFGTGKAGDTAKSQNGGFTNIATFGTACKLESACLALAIISIFFYIFSAAVSLGLGRHHQREKRFTTLPGDSSLATNNNNNGFYPEGPSSQKSGGFFGRLFRRATNKTFSTENRLPEHTHPNQLGRNNTNRMSYPPMSTVDGNGYERVSLSDDHNRYESGYGYQQSGVDYNNTTSPYGQNHETQMPYPTHQPQTQPPRRYGDGIYDA